MLSLVRSMRKIIKARTSLTAATIHRRMSRCMRSKGIRVVEVKTIVSRVDISSMDTIKIRC